MVPLTKEQWKVLRRVLLDETFQCLIGAEDWDLTEHEEDVLWDIVKLFETSNQ